jgi:hypothetical protein
MQSLLRYFGVYILVGLSAASPTHENPFEALARRELSAPSNSLQVDLGYEIYAGVSNSTTKVNSFKGQV